MPAERVVDASVLAAIFFQEIDQPRWDVVFGDDVILIAPSFLALEMASIAAKKIWRGEADERIGAQAIKQSVALTSRPLLDTALAARAMELAARYRFSAYDATYMALAEARETRVITLDRKWVKRAEEANLAGLVGLAS